MRCAKYNDTKCPGTGKIVKGENVLQPLRDHLPNCKFNVDAAKQRSALAEKSFMNPENPLRIFQEVRDE